MVVRQAVVGGGGVVVLVQGAAAAPFMRGVSSQVVRVAVEGAAAVHAVVLLWRRLVVVVREVRVNAGPRAGVACGVAWLLRSGLSGSGIVALCHET